MPPNSTNASSGNLPIGISGQWTMWNFRMMQERIKKSAMRPALFALLFDEKKLKKLLKYPENKKSTYYKAILQHLFFATLNTEMGKRRFRIKNDSGRDGHFF